MLESAARESDPLPHARRIALLESEISALGAQLLVRDQRIKLLEEILRLLQAGRYGVSREKLTEPPGQGALFNEVEVIAELIELAGGNAPLNATPERENKKTSKDKPGRKALASHLPRVDIRHELPETERICACGCVRTEIDVEPSEQLDYVPAKIQVIRHLRVKYACSACETGSVSLAPAAAQILPKTNAAPGLLAQIVTSKYVDALPLYRQEQIFARHGVNLSRATQAAWIMGLIEPLTPLLNLMNERLRESGYIRMDETPLQVLKSDKAPQSDHWMWVRVSGPPRERIILFDYHPSRSSEAAEQLLTGTSGFLQTDGYTAYDGVARKLHLTHVGCMAHYPEPLFMSRDFRVRLH